MKTNIKTDKVLRLIQPKKPEEKSNPKADENILLLWLCGSTTKRKPVTLLGFFSSATDQVFIILFIYFTKFHLDFSIFLTIFT